LLKEALADWQIFLSEKFAKTYLISDAGVNSSFSDQP